MSLNRAKWQARRKLVGKVGELTPGMTKKFNLSNGKYGVEATLFNYIRPITPVGMTRLKVLKRVERDD